MRPLVTSQVLRDLIKENLHSLTKSGRECRLLVPGLTNRIAQEIHHLLRSDRINSFLVVKMGEKTSEKEHLITAIGLTSKRIGSFVAIASPNEVSHIQDSVRGTGGAMRAPTFAEEWPWKDDGATSFKFEGRVLDDLLKHWAPQDTDHQWYKKIALRLRDDSLPAPHRGELLLEDVFGKIAEQRAATMSDSKELFLYVSGIPRPPEPFPDAGKIIENTQILCKKIIERHKEENLRGALRDRVLEVFPSKDQDTILNDLYRFLDKLGESANFELGILGLHGCWNDFCHWRRLDAKLLAKIFDIQLEADKIELHVQFNSNEDHSSVRSGKAAAMFFGDPAIFRVSYVIPEKMFTSNFRLRIQYGRTKILEIPIEEQAGEESLEISTETQFPKHGKPASLRFELAENTIVRKSTRFRLHICGPKRPNFAISVPPFSVLDAMSLSEDEDESGIHLVVEEPVRIYMFAWRSTEVSLQDENGNCFALRSVQDKIWVSEEDLDIRAEADGRAVRKCMFGEFASVFSFEAKNLEDGGFSIEEIFVDEIQKRQITSKFRHLLGLFCGDRRDYFSSLGGLDSPARRRTALAAAMTESRGYRPFLVDMFKLRDQSFGTVGDRLNHFGGEAQGMPLQDISLSDEAVELSERYAIVRQEILERILSYVDPSRVAREHPVYASHPIYVHNDSDTMESLLVRYLTCYYEILSYVDLNQKKLERDQIFALIYSDCAVHWDDSPDSSSFFLVGPWHPLAIAKRYMVQSSIVERAMRKNSKKDNDDFLQLALLLKRVQGFRWIPKLSNTEKRITHAYSMITSDPGWHFAVEESQVGKERIERALLQNLGLSTAFDCSSDNSLAESCLRGFQRAFPSRRSIGLRIRKGYDPRDIIRTIDRHLHEGGDDQRFGDDLPGGARLYFEEVPGEDIDATWTEPPLYVYQYAYEEEKECLRDGNPDIYMLPPRPQVSARDSDEDLMGIPRGVKQSSVFCQPLEWLTEGQGSVPKAVVYEIEGDGPDGVSTEIGAAYRCVLGKICDMSKKPPTMMYEIGLPAQLGAPWAVIPGYSVSPGVLVRYVKNSSTRHNEDRVLWDYKFDVADKRQSYFLLSAIPKSFPDVARQFLGDTSIENNFIQELGEIGVAIGNETLKSGRHALGVVGLIGAIRLLSGGPEMDCSPLFSTNLGIGVLLPVDSFTFFEQGEYGTERRADLLVVRMYFIEDSCTHLYISACGVESKLVSDVYTRNQSLSALEQATSTLSLFRNLLEVSLMPGGIPERLALLEMLKFGLRVATSSALSDQLDAVRFERSVYQAILRGNYSYVAAKYAGILVSTEGKLDVPDSVSFPEGLWIRLSRDHWPGASETSEIGRLRKLLCELFPKVSFSKGATLVDGSKSSQAEEPLIDAETRPMGSSQTEQSSVSTINADARAQNDVVTQMKGILLGVDEGGFGMYFDPQARDNSLENTNMMITGSSGMGKTQFLKYLIFQMRQQGKNVMVVDLKNDFASDKVFCDVAQLEQTFVSFDGLPFNPLIPYPVPHPATNELYIQCAQYIEGLVSVIKRVYKLGAQQQASVKNIIHRAFSSSGIATEGSVKFNQGLPFPDFSIVGKMLEQENPAAYNRLDPLFRLGLFKHESKSQSFDHLIGRSGVIDLSQIPSNEIKNVLAQLIVLSAHSYYNAQPHSGRIRQFLVFDEAHRVLQSDFILNLVRECRAYGVGVILSSQYPSDFPSDAAASIATKIIFGNGRKADKVREITQLLGCEEKSQQVAALKKFEAIVGSHHSPNKILYAMHYPLLLIWTRLKNKGEASLQDLEQTEGFDVSRSDINDIVQQLIRLGLVKAQEETVWVIRRDLDIP